MDRDRAVERVEAARVARLATVTADQRVDLVPITFAVDDGRIVTAIDHKPKSTARLKRLDNIGGNPVVSLLLDEYHDEDWSQLWWVRLRGVAQIVEAGDLYERSIKALVAKYPQYQSVTPTGPAIVIEVIRWQWWSGEGIADG
ncbi:MAG TPA: TIGR03668 family PPOX class F420-dependent oxidoreductase [Acidimicrobiales bacterium]